MAVDDPSLCSIDEGARKRFEAAWKVGQPEPLEGFVPPPDDPRYLATLEELVQIELEFAWKAARAPAGAAIPPPTVDDYLARFPQLDRPAIVLRLLHQEYWVRHQYGDAPPEKEFRRRCPGFEPPLRPTLTAVPGSTPVSAELPQVAGYEVLEELGHGGMGIVYKARQQGLKRLVALKMLLAGQPVRDDLLARFRREAEALARLRHPNIVQVYEIDEHNGRPYFALEFVEGGSLSRQLAAGPPAAHAAAHTVETLARAIHAAHDQGIIHRDLKPGNVLLTVDGTPKIADFGLAKQLDGANLQTQTGAILGTPAYMAPEQAQGAIRQIGPPTDVYSLGAILYEMLTGRPPFEAPEMLALLEQVRLAEPARPSSLRPQVPRDLETVCLKCLEKVPGRRYASAAELADDLARFCAGEPVRARPVSPLGRLRGWVRRRPAAAALWAAGFLLAVALAVTAAATLRALIADARAEKQEWRREISQRKDVHRFLVEGRAAVHNGDLAAAQVQAENAMTLIQREPTLTDLSAEAEALLKWIRDQRELAANRAQAVQRYERFRGHRDAALFHATLQTSPDRTPPLTGPDPLANLEATRTAVRQALDAVGVVGGQAPAADFLPHEPEFKQVFREGCYELLVILADAVAATPPVRGKVESSDLLKEAVQLLDRAARLAPPAHAHYRLRAECLRRLGDQSGADDARARAEALTPATALDWFLLGTDKLKRGELSEAAADFRNALRLQPGHFWARYYVALGCLQAGQPREAEARLDECVRQQPTFAAAYLLRAQARALQGIAEREAGRQDQAAALFAASDQDFGDALARAPADLTRWLVHLNRGALRLQQERLPDAEHELKQARALKPDQYPTYVLLAQVYERQGNRAGAFDALGRAIQLYPVEPAIYRTRAQLYLKQGDTAAALLDLDAAVQLHPPGSKSVALAEDHSQRGQLLRLLRRLEEARTACDAALAIDANNPAIHGLRAQVLLDLADRSAEAPQRKKLREEALQNLDGWVKSGKADAYRQRARLRADLGDHRGAQDDYSDVVRLEPRDAAAYTARGWVCLLQGNAAKSALGDFEAALRLDPESPDALVGRGNARAELGQFRPAAQDAEKAAALGQKERQVLYHAARIHALICARAKVDARPASGLLSPTARDGHKEKAIQLLRRTLQRTDPKELLAFWQDVVQQDSGFRWLRATREYQDLAKDFSLPFK
jgi:tetratricopeptide (TPR) repeat protein/predicted Ser/Thr protein kinase